MRSRYSANSFAALLLLATSILTIRVAIATDKILLCLLKVIRLFLRALRGLRFFLHRSSRNSIVNGDSFGCLIFFSIGSDYVEIVDSGDLKIACIGLLKMSVGVSVGFGHSTTQFLFHMTLAKCSTTDVVLHQRPQCDAERRL